LFLGHKTEHKTVRNFQIFRHLLSWYARCLKSGVPRTKDSNLLLLLSGSKSFRRFLVLLLTMAATSALGQESVLTLAMVRYDPSPAWMPAVARNHSTANILCYDASASRLQYEVALLQCDKQNATDFSSYSRLEKQSGPNQHDLFQLVHKQMYADGRTGKWVDIAAGYGHIFGDEPSIRKNSAEWERPGCAYLKASFSF